MSDSPPNLAKYLANRTHKGFVPRPRFFPVGDYMTYFWSEERCWSERVDEYLTLYHGVDSGELCGVAIKGVRGHAVASSMPTS